MADSPGLLWLVSRVYSPDEGGVQTYTREVAHAYAGLGWRVMVFAKSSAGPRREADKDGVELIDVGPGSVLDTYLRLLRAMAAAWRRGERPSVIHACTWRSAIPALLFRRLLVVTVHGREVGRPRGAAYLLMRLVLHQADRVVAVSGATRSLLLGRQPQLVSKCVVAWNGTTLQPLPNEQADDNDEGNGLAKVEILTVCRLVPRKNVAASVRALSKITPGAGRRIHRIAGRGPESGVVRDAIKGSSNPDDTELLGYVDAERLVELYRRADIFLHPQISLEDGAEFEGFGISVADAMDYGVACVVGIDGGPAELVQDGVTGLLVDGRSEAAIAGAIEHLLRDPTLRRRMGRTAQHWAQKNLSWRRHCQISLDFDASREEAGSQRSHPHQGS